MLGRFGLAAVAALILFASEARSETILDSTPNVSGVDFSFDSFDITFGGTFVVPVGPDTVLTSFTLRVSNTTGPGPRAVVLPTLGGTPVDTVLWESPTGASNPTSIGTYFTYTPGITLTPGGMYFIGLDNGRLTSGAGDFSITFSTDTFAGEIWENDIFFPPGWNNFPTVNFDVTSRITLNEPTSTSDPVPEPGTLALLLTAAALFGARRRTRS